MKNLLLVTTFLLYATSNLSASGVGIADGVNGLYLQLDEISVEVNVDNQVSTTKTTQVFRNTLGENRYIKYGFPMPEGASATSLRYKNNGIWYEAVIGPTPPDTVIPGPGGNIQYNLTQYLGDTPLYMNIENAVMDDSTLVVELTYVELLHYELGDVFYTYNNDYTLIQSSAINLQEFDFSLTSLRNIDSIRVTSSHPVTWLTNNGNTASLHSELFQVPVDEHFQVKYTLSAEELGLFSLSTLIPPEELPDDHGGFFLFAAEPEPGNATDVIDKVFTLVIDRSGSMEWDQRLIQAKIAASYIIQNMNEGDLFNIVDYAALATTFSEQHLPVNSINIGAALDYIDQLEPTWEPGLAGTNISAALDMAIPQFSSANDSTANIIIFMTDGEANQGITNTQELLAHVDDLVQQNNTRINLFTFGLGININVPLLTLLASNNNGLSEFVGNDEVEEKIINFYRKIKNPVLLDTEVSFSPDIITETYPAQLQNLFIGQQLYVTGRYSQAVPVTVTLSGQAFGTPVSYDFQMDLGDTANTQYQFLTKLWAKQKIEQLLIEYYGYPENSPEAEALKEQIVEISIGYSVISPFTSFQTITLVEDDIVEAEENLIPDDIELIGNYPNPFNPSTNICFKVNSQINDIAVIRIYNILGQLVKVLHINISGPGRYEITWDGTDESGSMVTSGQYIYMIDCGSYLLHGKMMLLK